MKDTPCDFNPDAAFGSLVRQYGIENDFVIAAAQLLQTGDFDYTTYISFIMGLNALSIYNT